MAIFGGLFEGIVVVVIVVIIVVVVDDVHGRSSHTAGSVHAAFAAMSGATFGGCDRLFVLIFVD